MGAMILQVDPFDHPIGPIEKMEAHRKGILHRAFSIFLFRNQTPQLLLQRRALTKYHSGGLWTNTCCGHPAPEIDIQQAAQQRLQEEMGIEVPLKRMGTFYYKAKVGDLIEHEIDHLFFGHYDGPIQADPSEVADYGWFDLEWIKKEAARRPADFTIWFRKILKKREITG